MSTTSDTTTGRHPVAELDTRLRGRLDELSGVAVWSMSDAEVRAALVGLTRDISRLEALRLQVLAEADRRDATALEGAASPAVYVAVETRQTRRAAKSDLKLAHALEEHEVLAAALAAGHADAQQARVIVLALGDLHTSGEFAVDREQRLLAEKHLVACCEHHDADELRVLGRRVLEVIAPDLADAYEGKKLEAEEAAAARRAAFTMVDDGQGLCHFRGRMRSRYGAMVRKAIQSLTNPTRTEFTTGSPIDTNLPSQVRDGIAFTQIIEAIDSHWLPTHGGVGATVVVTMTLDQLIGKLDGVCGVDTGGQLTAGEARRLACRAGVIPIVLGGPSIILDAGIKRRFHTEAQRIVLGVRDGGCTAEGCDVPPAMCHAHHDMPHGRGGPTSVANGRLLCGHHHRRIHDPAFEHRIRLDNTIEFHRRSLPGDAGVS